MDDNEFDLLEENRREWNLSLPLPPRQRLFVPVDGLRHVSGIQWFPEPARVVLLHGRGQNAHTFDTTLLALGAPALALDLPHHGHSDASVTGPSGVVEHARDVVAVLDSLDLGPVVLVGMSLGGLVSLLVAEQRPERLTHLVLLDITPGIDPVRARAVLDFLDGPESFDSLEEMVRRTIEHHPGRSVSSLRRGVIHNARQRPDGRWVWRHQQYPPALLAPTERPDLWPALEALGVPVTLVHGDRAPSVVTDGEIAEFRQRRPRDEVVTLSGGHSLQGDDPLGVAAVLRHVGGF
ncbi:MAG: alpha/beta hydrolase [Acidimicrobiaceae bacterium]|nr:alpha/beta hydrolase [Acidimicrobiaceae bacterium]